MYSRPRQPQYLLWSIPFWIAAILLGLYVAFGRGSGDEQEPRVVFSVTQTTAAPTQTPPAAATIQPTLPPSPTAAPTQTPAPVTYTVQTGESLTSICASELPDLPDCVEAIVTLNGLAGPDVIAVGQVLELPSASAPGGGVTATPTP